MTTGLRLRVLFVRLLPVAGVAILLLALWKQQADFGRMKRDYGRLQAQYERLRQNATQTPVEADGPSAAPAEVQPLAPADATARPSEAQAPEPEPNKLTLAGAEVTRIPNGLVANLRFLPSKTGPLGVLALVIRLPKNGNASILDLALMGSTTYAEVGKRVSEDGKFAVFQGTVGEAEEVLFALSVTESATADVRGTCGINPFQLDIQPAGANVRDL